MFSKYNCIKLSGSVFCEDVHFNKILLQLEIVAPENFQTVLHIR